jgi:hypothetical protein
VYGRFRYSTKTCQLLLLPFKLAERSALHLKDIICWVPRETLPSVWIFVSLDILWQGRRDSETSRGRQELFPILDHDDGGAFCRTHHRNDEAAPIC